MDSSFSFSTFCFSVLWPEGCAARAKSLHARLFKCFPDCKFLQIVLLLIRHGNLQEHLLSRNACYDFHSIEGTSKTLAQQQNRTQTLKIQWRNVSLLKGACFSTGWPFRVSPCLKTNGGECILI